MDILANYLPSSPIHGTIFSASITFLRDIIGSMGKALLQFSLLFFNKSFTCTQDQPEDNFSIHKMNVTPMQLARRKRQRLYIMTTASKSGSIEIFPEIIRKFF